VKTYEAYFLSAAKKLCTQTKEKAKTASNKKFEHALPL
jgi:hypothetical protein